MIPKHTVNQVWSRIKVAFHLYSQCTNFIAFLKGDQNIVADLLLRVNVSMLPNILDPETLQNRKKVMKDAGIKLTLIPT